MPNTSKPLDAEALINALKCRGDTAYTHYAIVCQSAECRGAAAKLKAGEFGDQELKAHVHAAEELGRHRAYYEVIAMLCDDGSVVLNEEHHADLS